MLLLHPLKQLFLVIKHGNLVMVNLQLQKDLLLKNKKINSLKYGNKIYTQH